MISGLEAELKEAKEAEEASALREQSTNKLIEDNKKEIAKLQGDLSAANSEVKAEVTRRQTLQQQQGMLESAEIARLGAEVEELKKSLADGERQTNSLNKQIDEQTDVISGLEAELKEAVEAKDEHAEQLEAKESLIISLKEDMGRLLEQQRESTASHEKELSDLRDSHSSKLATLQKEIEDASVSFKKLQDEIEPKLKIKTTVGDEKKVVKISWVQIAMRN